MKQFVKLFFLISMCFCCQLNADWNVTLNDTSKVTLSVCKNNLEKEWAVFHKAFTHEYKGTEIEQMVCKKYKDLDAFLVAAFEDDLLDFKNNKKDTLFITAKDADGKVIGFVSFDKNSACVYKRQLAVDPEFQKKGLGTLLTFAYLNLWESCTKASLIVRKLNTGAIKFYQKIGFALSDYAHDLSYNDTSKVYVGMERELDNDFVKSMLKKYKKVEPVDGYESTYKILSLPIVSQEVTKIDIKECGEPLVDLMSIGNKRIVPLTHFGEMYNAGHGDYGKVRVGLYERLLLLLEYLPENVGLAVFEGYRPLWKQKEYFVKNFKKLAEANKDKNLKNSFLEDIYVEASKLVSPFIDNVPVHCTGAAIDLMLFKFNDNGLMELLDLGTFGVVFGPNNQFQTLTDTISAEQEANRKMLLDAAAKAGLVNYGYEWWHYSYGDRAWAYVENKENAIYGIALAAATSEVSSKDAFFKSLFTRDASGAWQSVPVVGAVSNGAKIS